MSKKKELNPYFEASKEKLRQSIWESLPEEMKSEPFKMSINLKHESGAMFRLGLCLCSNSDGQWGLWDCSDCAPPQR